MNTANGQPTTQTQWPQQQTLTIQRTIQQPLDQRQVIWSQQSPVINYIQYKYFNSNVLHVKVVKRKKNNFMT